MRNKFAVTLIAALVMLAAVLGGSVYVKAAQKRPLLRIGVYDSRAIAIAYAPSSYNEQQYQKLKAELDKAEAAGDAEKVKAIKEQGSRGQQRMHLQGFGSAPVHDLIAPVKDKLAELAAANEVDVIVSKWEFDYIAADAEFKDITDQMAALYNPGPKQLEWIRQMKDMAPRPEQEILAHPD